MHEDIINGFYNDPFEFDDLKKESFDDYAASIVKLQEDLHFLRDYKGGEKIDPESEAAKESGGGFILDRDRRRTMNTVRKTKKVAVGAWDSPEVHVEWPEPLVDAFMDELEEFKTKGSNTGYDNKALNAKIIARWGKEYIKPRTFIQ